MRDDPYQCDRPRANDNNTCDWNTTGTQCYAGAHHGESGEQQPEQKQWNDGRCGTSESIAADASRYAAISAGTLCDSNATVALPDNTAGAGHSNAA